MNNLCRANTVRQCRASGPGETATSWVPETLEVNVIFTDPEATAAALQTARSLSRDLRAVIRLRAGIVVPMQLSLGEPQVSLEFMERLLRGLAEQLEVAGCEIPVDLYVCRNWIETLVDVLRPDSLIVIGGRRHWWPTAESRVAGALRTKGHRVALVRVEGQTAESLR